MKNITRYMAILCVCSISAHLWAEDTVSGSVTFGKSASKPKWLRIAVIGESDHSWFGADVVRGGHYSMQIRGRVTDKTVVQCRDGGWLGQATYTVIGQAVPKPIAADSTDYRADIHLNPVKLVSRPVKVMTSDRKPFKSKGFKCKIEVSLLDGKKMRFRRFYNDKTSNDGTAHVSVPEAGKGVVALKVHSRTKDGTLYRGRKEFSFEDIRTRQVALEWTVEKTLPSIALHFKWDPAFSKELFAPRPGRALDQHTAVFTGPTNRWQAMWPDGSTDVYDLKPGKYSLDLKKISNPYYTITKKPKEITVPKDLTSAAKVEVWLRPVQSIRLAGRVVDAATGKPVPSAQVNGASSSVQTDEKGRFCIKGTAYRRAKLRIQRPGYRELWVAVPDTGSDVGTVKLLPRKRRK